MAKRPENMTPEERLARIRSLERKAFQLEVRAMWAEREAEGTRTWAQSAFAENRRLTDRLGQLIDRIPGVIEPDEDRPLGWMPTDSPRYEPIRQALRQYWDDDQCDYLAGRLVDDGYQLLGQGGERSGTE